MRDMQYEPLRLRIRFEFAIEVILSGIIFILFGLAFLLTSNLLAFHWITAILIALGLFLIYLKGSSYLEIQDDKVKIQYFKFLHKKTFEVEQIRQFVFYEDGLMVEMHTKSREVILFYLKQKNREKLLNYIVKHYPNIPCLFYDKTD